MLTSTNYDFPLQKFLGVPLKNFCAGVFLLLFGLFLVCLIVCGFLLFVGGGFWGILKGFFCAADVPTLVSNFTFPNFLPQFIQTLSLKR